MTRRSPSTDRTRDGIFSQPLRTLGRGWIALALTVGTATPSALAEEPATPAVAPAAVPVGEAATKALVQRVEAKFKDVTSMKAQFTQIVHNEIFGDETEKGEVVIKRPSMMRWAYGTEKQFISNGKKLWIYTASDKQAIEYDDIASARGSADQLLTSLDKIGEYFDIKVLTSSEAGHELVLTPKQDAQFKRVRMALTGDLMPQTVVITDAFDAVTELQFSAVELNATVADTEFEFSAPPGVDVIKATN